MAVDTWQNIMVSGSRYYKKSKIVKMIFIFISGACLLKVHRKRKGEDGGKYTIENVPLKLLKTTSEETPSVRLPQAFILGAGKCGTATLFSFLSLHPNIITPLLAEMNFYDQNYKFSEGWHRARLRPSRSDQITLESSPGYFHDEKVPDRILKMNHSAKFIVILREPVQRAVSQYIHFKTKDDNFTFEFHALNIWGKVNTKWDAISYGVYIKPMERWLKKVPLKQFYIVDGNAFRKDPLPHLKGIERFLGLPRFFKRDQFVFVPGKGFYCLRPQGNGTVSCMSEHKGRRHPPINSNVVNKLRMYYKPFNQRLSGVIGRRFDWAY